MAASAQKPRYKPNQQVKGGVKKRAIHRAGELGMNLKKLKRGGITGHESRVVRKRYIKHKKEGAAGRDIAGNPITRVVNAESRSEFGDQERLMDRQIRRSQGHEQTIGHAFDAYGQRMNALQQQAAQATQLASAGYADQAQQSGNAVEALTGNAQAQLQARAQQTGADVSQVAADAQGANQLAQTYQAGVNTDRQRAIAQAGLGEVGDLTGRAAVGARESIAALGRNRQETKDLEADRSQLAGKKRDWRTARRSELLRQSQEQYVALLGLRSKAMSDEEDRDLRLKLGMIDARQAAKERAQERKENAKDRASREKMNDQDNATSRANNQNSNRSSGGGNAPGGLTQSQQGEWLNQRNFYETAANRMRKNLKKYKSTKSAWHQTAVDLGGELNRLQMNAIWAIAKGNKTLPRSVRQFLNTEFPGGRSPWSK